MLFMEDAHRRASCRPCPIWTITNWETRRGPGENRPQQPRNFDHAAYVSMQIGRKVAVFFMTCQHRTLHLCTLSTECGPEITQPSCDILFVWAKFYGHSFTWRMCSGQVIRHMSMTSFLRLTFDSTFRKVGGRQWLTSFLHLWPVDYPCEAYRLPYYVHQRWDK